MTGQEIRRLVRELGALLMERGETLAVAESCTGGGVSQAITALSGSSGWFDVGFVTYSNGAKERLLGVHADTLRDHGAVSAETALEMAAGALERGRTAWSLALTGIAGPTGGTATRPVGTVVFAWAGRSGLLEAETMRFGGDRGAVRRQSVEHSLDGLLKRIPGAAGA